MAIILVRRHRWCMNSWLEFFRFCRDAHPMAMMVCVVGALSAFPPRQLTLASWTPQNRDLSLGISKIPTIAAMCYRYSNGLPFNYPKNNLSYSETSIWYRYVWRLQPNPVLARADASLFCMPTIYKTPALQPSVWAGSSRNLLLPALLPVSPVRGVCHVVFVRFRIAKMLDEIGAVSNVAACMEECETTQHRLMGFGHRVSRNMDPRASIMCGSLLWSLAGPGLGRRSEIQTGDGVGTGCVERPVLYRTETVSKRRFLFRHRPVRAGHPDRNVYRHLRPVAQLGLDFALARDD